MDTGSLPPFLVKDASCKRLRVVSFHLQEVPRMGEFLATEVDDSWLLEDRGKWALGVTTNRYWGSFWGAGKLLKCR